MSSEIDASRRRGLPGRRIGDLAEGCLGTGPGEIVDPGARETANRGIPGQDAHEKRQNPSPRMIPGLDHWRCRAPLPDGSKCQEWATVKYAGGVFRCREHKGI